MDYIEQINGFHWFTKSEKAVSNKAQLMYLKILDRAYHSGWQEWFPIGNVTLMDIAGIAGEKTFYEKRQELLQLGLIRCEPGKGKKRSCYHIAPFIKNRDGRYELQKSK